MGPCEERETQQMKQIQDSVVTCLVSPSMAWIHPSASKEVLGIAVEGDMLPSRQREQRGRTGSSTEARAFAWMPTASVRSVLILEHPSFQRVEPRASSTEYRPPTLLE